MPVMTSSPEPEHRTLGRGPHDAAGWDVGRKQRKAWNRIWGLTRFLDRGAGTRDTAVALFAGPDPCAHDAADQGFSGIDPPPAQLSCPGATAH